MTLSGFDSKLTDPAIDSRTSASDRDEALSPDMPNGAKDQGIRSHPLALEGWVEFTRRAYGLNPLRITYGGGEGQPRLDALLYVDDKGRIRRPLRIPYFHIAFAPTPVQYPHKASRQWLELTGQLAEDMRERGVVNEVPLQPDVQDVRPWQWAGFRASVSYTYVLDFPHPESLISNKIRSNFRRSEKEGFRFERTDNMDDAFACLEETERRKGYDLGIDRSDLRLAHHLLGSEHLQTTVAYAPNGEAASAVVNLHQNGMRAIGWLAGTRTEYLKTGVAATTEFQSHQSLMNAGSTGIDLCGGNIPGVAKAKASYGAKLIPYYSVETYSARRVAKWAQLWMKQVRERQRT